jgi:hypothetical protein
VSVVLVVVAAELGSRQPSPWPPPSAAPSVECWVTAARRVAMGKPLRCRVRFHKWVKTKIPDGE